MRKTLLQKNWRCTVLGSFLCQGFYNLTWFYDFIIHFMTLALGAMSSTIRANCKLVGGIWLELADCDCRLACCSSEVSFRVIAHVCEP